MVARTPQAGPHALALVKAFVNSNSNESRIDACAAPDRLHAWLAAHDLLDGDVVVTEADCRRAVAVREAFRSLLLANNGVTIDDDTVQPLNQLAAAVPWQAHITPAAQAQLTPTAAGIEGALTQILLQAAVAMIDGTWPRLKACRDDSCHWAFYDRTKNQSRVWCTMRYCGSRNKARAYQRRLRSRVP